MNRSAPSSQPLTTLSRRRFLGYAVPGFLLPFSVKGNADERITLPNHPEKSLPSDRKSYHWQTKSAEALPEELEAWERLRNQTEAYLHQHKVAPVSHEVAEPACTNPEWIAKR